MAERTYTDQSSVSVVISKLVEGGYVQRDRDRRDARRLVLTLTKEGRAIAEKSPPAAQERILEVLDRLPAADRRRFAETFARIIEELGEAKGVPPMLFEDELRDDERRTTKK